MNVSRAWLQKYFDQPLPDAAGISEALTFHSSEVEEIVERDDDTMIEVKVLPDRACYALSHRGIASELAAALDIPLVRDPLAEPLPEFAITDEVSITVCDIDACPRYMAALVRGVKVGQSPQWLKAAVESVGQRSINNVVDATNYVMLNLGQPLHAFDAGKLVPQAATDSHGGIQGVISLSVRRTLEGEKMTSLTGDEYTLPEDTLVIADGNAPEGADILGIAGIKGGKRAEVTEATTDLIIEGANFDGTLVRRTAQAIKLFTDASTRFQNKPSPDLVAFGMRDVLALITDIAGGEVVGGFDSYPAPEPPRSLSITIERINAVLGTGYAEADIATALQRLGLPHAFEESLLTVQVPAIRRDLTIPEDLAEEIGRVLGYEHIPGLSLPAISEAPDQRAFRGIERIKDLLLERGYVEISTPSFAATGAIELANPLQNDKPFLRATLSDNLREALARAKNVAPRVIGPEDSIKLFELGTVFTNAGEHFALALGYEPLVGKANAVLLQDDLAALADAFPAAGIVAPKHDGQVVEVSLAAADLESIGEGYEPPQITLGPFQPYSTYPFALRDIAVWTPDGTQESEVALLIQKEAGNLLARMDLFDRFEKVDKETGVSRTSFAFRLVFEASDRTLADTDLDPLMVRITDTLNAQEGWEVR